MPCDGTKTIGSTADATSLAKECPTVFGDLVIASGMAADVNLTGVLVVDGHMTNEPCSSNSPCNLNITKISSNTIKQIGGDVEFRDLGALTNISFPALKWADNTIVLENLASLETIGLTNLTSVDQLQVIGAPKLSSIDADHVDFGPGYFGIHANRSSLVEISGVGLESLGSLLHGPMWGSTADIVAIYDDPKLNYIQMNMPYVGNLTILGNGNVTLLLGPTWENYVNGGDDAANINMGTVLLSGLSNFTIQDSVEDFTATAFSIVNNTFRECPLWLNDIENLTIASNPELNEIDWPDLENALNWTLQSVVIQDNPNLEMNTTIIDAKDKSTGDWLWARANVSTLVFDGAFSNAFL